MLERTSPGNSTTPNLRQGHGAGNERLVVGPGTGFRARPDSGQRGRVAFGYRARRRPAHRHGIPAQRAGVAECGDPARGQRLPGHVPGRGALSGWYSAPARSRWSASSRLCPCGTSGINSRQAFFRRQSCAVPDSAINDSTTGSTSPRENAATKARRCPPVVGRSEHTRPSYVPQRVRAKNHPR